jgi:isoleucyl-tRNA synthetase
MFTILDTMVRLLAPILTFTADEIWAAMPPWEGKAASVHLTLFPEIDTVCQDEALGERWRSMISVRAEIAKAVENARKDKVIGHSLDAAVDIALPDHLRAVLAGREEDMRALLIVSQFRILEKEALEEAFESREISGLRVRVTKAKGDKCHRCWIYSEHLGKNPAHPTLCERCETNI